jgi:ABC-type multidrug transport system fused ATPase/permease subunit
VLAILVGAVGTIATGGAMLVVLWMGAYAPIDRSVSVGEVMFLYSSLGLFVGALDRVGPSVIALQQAKVAAERVSDIRHTALEDDGPRLSLAVDGRCHRLSVRNVTLWYRPSMPVLRNIDLEIEQGETVALLGETGSGKSSLLMLLNGLLHPNGGGVLVNGKDVRDLNLRQLRRSVALVLQEPSIMAGTILDNITLGCESASRQEVEAAAMTAMAHEFIERLPRGYDYEVGQGGASLSGGQKQRISIARALVRQPSGLLLDEATSSVDSETERAIWSRLRLSDRGRITVIATHRLTVASLDR